MKIKDKLPELLAPAGDFECLVAAVRGGADAVYIGGKSFSARAYAKNFDIDEIKKAVSYCHLHGVRLYVTMNILLYDTELDEALRFAEELYVAGVDALIIADLGLISLIRKRIPDFELHASTQMSVHNSIGADKAYELGCSRVVLARELSGRDIETVTEVCKAETEVFLHGALCVCHSGQCLFSSMIGGRSGNRGECAQPCRLPYNNGKYVLSLSDLSLSNHVSELISYGVASLKIEGRMKSPDYVYTVTSIYRRLLDEHRNSNDKEDSALKAAFSRSGFTDGYFAGNTFGKMTGIRTEEDKRVSKNAEKGGFSSDKVPVKAKVGISLGKESFMTLSYKSENGQERETTVFGAVAETAINAPLTEAGVKERLSKMGNTFLSLSPDDIEIALDNGVNISPSLLNALRRAAAEKFEFFGREARFVEAGEEFTNQNVATLGRTALFHNIDVFSKMSVDELSYFDVVFVPLASYSLFAEKANGVYIPPIIMENELLDVSSMLADASENGAKYALVGNLSHIDLARKAGLIVVGDIRMNVCNKHSLSSLLKMGAGACVLSAELTARQVRDIGGGAVVYGRLPLMITEKCFMKDTFGCEKCGSAYLIDRKGIKFPMLREYKHRNIIFNSACTYMGDKLSELSRSGNSVQHFIFSLENEKEISTVISAFKRGVPYPFHGAFRRMGKRKTEA